MPRALGLDLSTQSCSALVIDTDAGQIVAEASVNFGARLPQYGAPSGFIPNGPDGVVHADPCMWLDALELLLTDLQKQCDIATIDAISGAGQQHGSIYLNERWTSAIVNLSPNQSLSAQIAPCLSRATSPIWMDTSTGAECAEIAAAVGGNNVVLAKSGSNAIERFTGPQIRRFFKTSPDGYQQTARIHLVSSFFASVLSGCDAPIDTGDGAGMNLVNLQTWDWDDGLLNATAPDLHDKLPPVCNGNQQIGSVAKYFVEKFGFRAGVPITIFTGDNPSSLVGIGASQPGKVVISLGTSDTFFSAMPDVVTDPNGYGHVFGNPSGGSMSLQCFVNGSLAREAVKERFAMDWDAFTSALKNSSAGNNGNIMTPFFRPEISPRLDIAEPVLRGDVDFTKWMDRNAAIRACIEGQFLNMKLRSAWMQLTSEVIYLTGGASKNDAIAQVAADVFQAKVQRLAVSSSVALGAAMRAAQGLGVTLDSLEAQFCEPAPGSTTPQVGAGFYQQNEEALASLIDELLGSK